MCRDCGCSTRPLSMMSQTEMPKIGSIDFKNLKQTNTRTISVEESIYQKNLTQAQKNTELFLSQNLQVFNFMSSPGSGKTTLLSKLLPQINKQKKILTLVGDQETSYDADRLKAVGLDSLQINTRSACHLDAERIFKALPLEQLNRYDWLVIENVGNLVCPAAFDLGEKHKVALLSVTEGEEKPLKYPLLFEDAHLIVITKSDLIPHLDFNRELLMANLRQRNKFANIIFVSSKTQEGLQELKLEMERMACV